MSALPPASRVAALSQSIVVSSLDESAARGDGVVRVGTHDGTFHCDEALACAMLKMLPAYEGAIIVRTRDVALLAKCDIVVDVGAKYEPASHRYDHHQRGFTDTMSELGCKTKLSSAGLVYRHFGVEVLQLLMPGADATEVKAAYSKAYMTFMEEIDGIDNGVEQFQGGIRNYEVQTTLSGRVKRLNPRWNEPSGPADANARFVSAMLLTGSEFVSNIEELASSWWPARSLVVAAMDTAPDVDPSQQVLVLDHVCPWDEHLFELEEERAVSDAAMKGRAKYVLYPDVKGNWRIQAVPVVEKSFESRKKLPEPWRGVRGEELSKIAGVEGCIFVHAGGFIGGVKTKEGALALAKKAIDKRDPTLSLEFGFPDVVF